MSRDQNQTRQQLVAVVGSLRTLNACDQVIVRAATETELIESLCQAIIGEEGYNLAWLGFASSHGGGPVHIRTCAGPAAGFVEKLHEGWENDPESFGLVASTMDSGRTHIISDIAKELPASTIRSRALEYGLSAMITLALKTETGPPGCLAIYSDKAGQFSREERQLLEQLADNLVYGLNALRVHQERAEQASEIHYMAYTDALTGLPNRRHLVNSLDSMLVNPFSSVITTAMLFIDLDGFKLINDALGHKVGDQVLREVGKRLQGAVRERDLVVRQGGDEFLAVMVEDPRHGHTPDEGEVIANTTALADRIIQHLGQPLTAGGFTHRLKASIGISLYPQHGENTTALIENADKAMYEAKKLGSGRSFLFSEDVSTSRQRRFSLESRLRLALTNNEFELYYQPVFELDSCRIVAVEALIRWPQEDGTVVMPGAFMPLVEETDLIQPVGDWVLETAARQLRSWHDNDHSLAMAVNLSINQLYPDASAQHFADLVRPHVDPLWMHLEVTENALMTNPSEIEALLTELHGAGFQLAIDDFGTGYSSLSRLQYLSIQSLKIDRSFVNELGGSNHKGVALVSIIQRMASSMNLLTIAEGIETNEQRLALLETAAGPSWGQGFWFSKAIPASELERLLAQQPD